VEVEATSDGAASAPPSTLPDPQACVFKGSLKRNWNS
jgi:hypothetical protein